MEQLSTRLVLEMMRMYFEQGGDITSVRDLGLAAERAGIDRGEAIAWPVDGGGTDEVCREVEEARRMGIRGVPWYEFNERDIVDGAVEESVFLKQLILAREDALKAVTSSGGTSVGLAALAVMRKDPQMMHLARKRYCSALHLLARAVQEPIQSNVENSVAAGFILSMFEVIVSEKSSTSYLWLQHAHGTAALLGSLYSCSRVPKDQARALLDVSYTSLLASLISGKPVPQIFLHLAENCEPVGGNPTSNDPLFLSIRLCSIMSSLVNLHVSAKQTFQYSQARLLASAISSDQALEAWAVSLPSSWAYQTFRNEPHHVYGSPWFARTWNYYRLSRILSNKIILYGLNAGSLSFQTMNPTLINKYKLQYDRSASVISELSKEIYTSLPTMFNFNRTGPTSIPLSLDVFFVVTILQSLVVLTGRSTVLRNWPSLTCGQPEEKFIILKEIMIRNLH